MISLTKLKRLMELRIRSSGEDFDAVFYMSVNDVISDLIVKTVLDVDPIDEDTPPTEVDLDEKYFRVFRDGVQYYMAKNAVWARGSDEANDADYRRSLAEAQGEGLNDTEAPVGLDYEDE